MSRGAPAKKPRRNARELTTSRPPPENLSARTDRVRTAKKTACEKWTLLDAYQISLFLPENSLLISRRGANHLNAPSRSNTPERFQHQEEFLRKHGGTSSGQLICGTGYH